METGQRSCVVSCASLQRQCYDTTHLQAQMHPQPISGFFFFYHFEIHAEKYGFFCIFRHHELIETCQVHSQLK